MTNNEIWQQAKADLSLSMPNATFDKHLATATVQSVAGDVWTMAVDSSGSVEMLQARLNDTVTNALAGVVGGPVDVVFVVRDLPEIVEVEIENPEGYATKGVVMDIYEMHFEGNIIPASWFEHLRYDSGKPNTNAIIVLSEIVYWYRPALVREEKTGRVVGYKKKFKADKLQRSYASFSAQFGFSKKQTRSAIDFLAEKGVITKELRDIATKDGSPLANVLFLEPVISRLRAITYSPRKADPYAL